MIRKGIILVLAVLAIGTFILGIVGIGALDPECRYLHRSPCPPDKAAKLLVWDDEDRSTRVTLRSGDGYLKVTYAKAQISPAFYSYDWSRYPNCGYSRVGFRLFCGEVYWLKGIVELGESPAWGIETSMPWWAPFTVFAAYPIITFVRGPVRRYRRRRKGLCIKCGYDLTGNVSGVCPECGSEVKRP